MEFYQAMTAPTEKIEAMKIWLISNKRTHMWNDGLSTSEAVYALTTSGKNWLKNNEAVTITLSNLKIVSSDYQQHAGTGYFKTTFEGDKFPPILKPQLLTILIAIPYMAELMRSSTKALIKSSHGSKILQLIPSSLPLHIKEMRLL